MDKEYDRMKFIEYIRPVLSSGKHTISVTQTVTSPQSERFTQTKDFYVASRAYTLDMDTVFNVAPSPNESGDLSKIIPFITLKNNSFPWHYDIMGDKDGVPVPWVALIVISSKEEIKESDITIEELLCNRPANTYFPDKSSLPDIILEKKDDTCHVIDMSKELFREIAPSFEDMTYLVHGRRVDLSHTEDVVTALDGDFSVVMANRFIPTGEGETLKSTVHLVSMMGMQNGIPSEYNNVRLVSLYHYNVYSVRDNQETFQNLINKLEKNTGIIGYDQQNETLKRGYIPKKHYTRSGEITYSLYRSPLIPYRNKEIDTQSKKTADGHLIYDSQNGVFDASYAAAFQLGRVIALNRSAESKQIENFRKQLKMKAHKELLSRNINRIDISEVLKNMIKGE